MDKKVAVGALALAGVLAGVLVLGGPESPPPQKPGVPPNAAHLWARQPDGGTGLRDPLPTLDDGGCQAWAQRCPDNTCARDCE